MSTHETLIGLLDDLEACVRGLPPVARPQPQPQTNRPPDTIPGLAAAARDCRACALAARRTQVVFGDGNPAARLLVVGEAPGAQEDEQGLPFVGEAGQLLDRMFAAIGLDRSGYYITNVVKCRPPGNRDPEPAELAACRAWLDAQLAAVRPLVICTLGRCAAQTLLGTAEGIGRLRGRVHDRGGIPLVPVYHPAYLLRSPEKKPEAWADLQLLRATLDERLARVP